MLHALVRDLAALPGVEVVTMRDGRLPAVDLPAEIHRVEAPWQFRAVWRRCLADCDAVWPVAPESGGILQDITARVVARGAVLLGSRPAAVRVAASKSATATRLTAAGLPAAPVYPLAVFEEEPDRKWVIKPDDGVGAAGVRVLRGLADYRRGRAALEPRRRYIAQPFLCGRPVSLCMLCRDRAMRLLSCNLQHIAVCDDAFTLLGCTVNAPGVFEAAYEGLAAGITAALPGLWGIVGLDLIATPEGAWVVDLNPRLTTSYVGLHASIGTNPAALVLELLQSAALPPGPALATAVPVDVNLEVLDVA